MTQAPQDKFSLILVASSIVIAWGLGAVAGASAGPFLLGGPGLKTAGSENNLEESGVVGDEGEDSREEDPINTEKGDEEKGSGNTEKGDEKGSRNKGNVSSTLDCSLKPEDLDHVLRIERASDVLAFDLEDIKRSHDESSPTQALPPWLVARINDEDSELDSSNFSWAYAKMRQKKAAMDFLLDRSSQSSYNAQEGLPNSVAALAAAAAAALPKLRATAISPSPQTPATPPSPESGSMSSAPLQVLGLPGCTLPQGKETSNDASLGKQGAIIDDAEMKEGPPEQWKEGRSTVRVVAARCDHASLLVDAENDVWKDIKRGLVIYLAFAKGADEKTAVKAAKQLLSLPILTDGHWGDGRRALSWAAAAKAWPDPPGICIVPQAALVNKFNGRTLQYHEQAPRAEGARLYAAFCGALRRAAARALGPPPAAAAAARTPAAAARGAAHRAAAAAAAAVAPGDLFRRGVHRGEYAAFDARGVPVADREGRPLAKSRRKKLEKIYRAQVARYSKARGGGRPAPGGGEGSLRDEKDKSEDGEEDPVRGGAVEGQRDVENVVVFDSNDTNLHEKEEGSEEYDEEGKDAAGHQQQEQSTTSSIAENIVIWGSWGKRQGLRITSECGPFSHILQF